MGGAARELSSSLEERAADPSEGHLLSFPHPSLKRQKRTSCWKCEQDEKAGGAREDASYLFF